MTTTTHDPLTVAAELAPLPSTEAESTPRFWARHYTAQAVACWAEFHALLNTPGAVLDEIGPRLGQLSALAVASTSAAIALFVPSGMTGKVLWSYTPELGALNGEWEEWLAETLDEEFGINPADIDPRYRVSDFKSPIRIVAPTPEEG